MINRNSSHHRGHLLTRVCPPQQESSTPLQERCKIVHVNPTQIIQEDLDDMEYDMLRNDLELGEDGKVPNILGAEIEVSQIFGKGVIVP